MSWYLTKFIYRIVCGDGLHTPQYDEQLRLIIAENREEALNKARRIGLREEDSFYNNKQQLVRWQFINITEIYPFNKMLDGAELFSRVAEQESADLYEYIINKKANNLVGNEIPELLEED